MALGGAGQVELRRLSSSRNSAREIYQVIAQLLRDTGSSAAALDCIAVGQGPGSFTGVRVAVAAAQSLAYALAKPVCAVSTLAAMAVVAGRQHGACRVAVCLDARMHEAYLGIYDVDDAGGAVACVPDSLVKPAAYEPHAALHAARPVGVGWQVYPELLRGVPSAAAEVAAQAADDAVWPDAAAVLSLAEAGFAAGALLTPAEALPNYLRNEVAHRGART